MSISKQRIFFIIGGLAIFLAAFFSYLFFTQELTKLKKQSLPILGKVPYFTLYDAENKPFTLRNLQGKIWVVDFMFTTCSGICPMLSRNMAKLSDLSVAHENIEFVSITVNPEYDSPAVLADYAKTYNADSKKWHFLTGSRGEIENLAVHGFKVGSVNEPIFHSGYFILVDPKGQIRGFYEGTKSEELKKLTRDIADLKNEEPK